MRLKNETRGKTMELKEVTTGFFADEKHGTKVHLVSNRKPICGVAVGKKMQYQWCANFAKLDYVECERCKKKYKTLLLREENTKRTERS